MSALHALAVLAYLAVGVVVARVLVNNLKPLRGFAETASVGFASLFLVLTWGFVAVAAVVLLVLAGPFWLIGKAVGR